MTNAVIATRHEAMYQPASGSPCWHSVKDAASASGASESAIRRALRAAGVTRVAGPAVRGMVELCANGRTGYLPYAK